jgi:hypothetical protein
VELQRGQPIEGHVRGSAQDHRVMDEVDPHQLHALPGPERTGHQTEIHRAVAGGGDAPARADAGLDADLEPGAG